MQHLFEAPPGPPPGLHFTRAIESLHRKAAGHAELAPGIARVIVADRGVGVGRSSSGDNISGSAASSSSPSPSRWFDAFYSTSGSRRMDPSYHYSRMFGAPYSGAGMGLLKSKVRGCCGAIIYN